MAPRKFEVDRKKQGSLSSRKKKYIRPLDYQKLAKHQFYNFLRDVKRNIPGVTFNKFQSKVAQMWRNSGREIKMPYSQIARKSRRRYRDIQRCKRAWKHRIKSTKMEIRRKRLIK
ncbi:uncharacterized protein LOC130901734 [Diorhabda carinulata]|uniref:uncharacterized protein LOC130901734 n=1 Tax=Diorhabda carinulata TaxID=1163345 RepID=UPI0025A07A98|nr:uncharacterized protein LOC130901734 [Diorhabda carinulata]